MKLKEFLQKHGIEGFADFKTFTTNEFPRCRWDFRYVTTMTTDIHHRPTKNEVKEMLQKAHNYISNIEKELDSSVEG